ncbi:MAG: hypothetical protein ABFS10_08440 [Bacteroidota bacterium]
MEKRDEKKTRLQGQIRAVRSGNRTTILDAIKEIRADSSISILPELFDLLLDQEDEEIIHATSSLLNDLKLKEAAQVLVGAIDDPTYNSIAKILVASCWQNGLSYGAYAESFARVAIEADYETAFEAFTVLEEAVGELEEEERAKLVKTVKHGLLKADDQKKLLLRELIKVIETY